LSLRVLNSHPGHTVAILLFVPSLLCCCLMGCFFFCLVPVVLVQEFEPFALVTGLAARKAFSSLRALGSACYGR